MGNKPFSQYYAEALSALPQAPSTTPSVPTKPVFKKLAQVDEAAKPFNFLDWGIDILSRPLYAVTETIDSALDSIDEGADTRAKFEQGDVAGGLQAVAGQTGRALTAGLRGFLSTDTEDKKLTSDLIEKTTDVVGKQVNPAYVDEQDNVNPVVKGIAGFAGDVALDPLTWLPGAAVAKGLNTVGRAVKSGAASTKGLGPAARVAKEADEASTTAAAIERESAADLTRQADIPEPIAPPQRKIDLGGEAPAPGLPKGIELNLGRQADEIAPTPKVDEPPAPKADRKAELGAKSSFNAGVKASKQPDGDAIRADGFADPEAFEAGRAAGDRKAFTEWYAAREQAVTVAPEAAPSPAVIADEAHKVLEAPPTAKTPQDFGFPDPGELVARVQAEVENLPLTKRGVPTIAGVRAALKALDEDALTKELLDVKLDVDGEIYDVRSWVDDLMHGRETPENALDALNDGLRALAEQGRFADEVVPDSPVSARESVAELAEVTPAPLRPSEVLDASPRVGAAEELLTKLGDRTGEGPSYGEYILSQSRDPKLANTAAVVTERGELLWKDVPKFLKAANKETELYKKVSTALTKKWKGRVTREKAKARKWNETPPLERFSQIVGDDDALALAEQALGIALTSRLRSVKDPAKFEALMGEIGDVISRKLNLDEIAKDAIKYDTTRSLLKTFGIDEDTLGTVEAVSPSSHVTEAVGAAQEAADLSRPKPRTSATQALIDSTATPEGGKTLAERAERLTPAERAVAEVVTRELGRDIFGIGLKKRELRPHRTNAGAARTDKIPGKGYAVWEGRINGPTQHNLSKGILNSLKDPLSVFRNAKGNTLNAGREYAMKKKELYQERSFIIHRMMDREGVAMHLGVREDDAMLSDWQLRAVLNETNPELTTMLLYNLQTGVPTTNLYAAVSAMLRGAPDDELLQILKDNTTRYKQGGDYLNPLAGEGTRYYGHRIFQNGKIPPAPGGAKWVKNPKFANGYFLQLNGEGLAKQALSLLKGAKPKLAELAQQNAMARKVRIETESAELTAAERAWLEEIVTDPSKMGVAIRATAQPEKTVQDMARDAGATQESVVLASINAETDIPTADKISAEGAARGADRQKATGDPQASKPIAQETHNKLIDDAQTLLTAQKDALAGADEAAEAAGLRVDPEASISDDTALFIDLSLAHAANPNADGLAARFGKALKSNYGFERISKFRHSAEVAAAMRRSAFIRQIGALVQRHGGALKGATTVKRSLLLKQAWNSVRAGAKGADPAVEAARVELESIFGTLFDTTKQESILGNVFFRNPVSVDHVNGELLAVGLKDSKGQPIQFDIATAADKARLNGTDTMTEMIEQWRTWDIDDPAEALLKLFAASERVATKAVIGQNFNRFVAEHSLISDVPKLAYARPIASGKSIFISMLDQEKYYDPEILKELSRLEDFMNASRSFKGGPGQFIHGFFDPMQQSWKYGMTVVRPGHHVRNLVGDASMTYLAEGMRFSVKSNHDAIRVLTAMHNKYDGYDFNRAMEGLGFREVPGSTDVLMSGRYGDMTIGQVYDAFYTRGLMNSYRHSEDILDEGLAPGGFARFMNRISLRGGKVEEIAGSVSQARDHYARMQHFLQYLYKAQKDGGRGHKLEDLFDNAAHQVKKYHPDGSMLAPFEAKYLRRIIPFYSWLRGAIPAMIESAALKPSRVTVFPKASYNLAIAMGVNPDGLENPFPEDQLFPSFLTDQVFGPQFGDARDGYFGFSPGIASVDVANQFLSGAPLEGTLRGIAGSTSPLFRIPAELMSGGAWGTGARINDASDYIDSNLPGVNYLSNISGYSVTGSAVGAITGEGLDEQLQVARGNKDEVDRMLSLANWLTGASIQNMSRPNYINFAEIEKRNAAAQSGEEARNAY